MIKIFKDNPLITASALVSAVIAILGAFWALDSHYATAADMQAFQNSVTQQLIQLRSDDLDNKIFALQRKKAKHNGKLDPDDEAVLERYKRQFDQLQSQLKSK